MGNIFLTYRNNEAGMWYIKMLLDIEFMPWNGMFPTRSLIIKQSRII